MTNVGVFIFLCVAFSLWFHVVQDIHCMVWFLLCINVSIYFSGEPDGIVKMLMKVLLFL